MSEVFFLLFSFKVFIFIISTYLPLCGYMHPSTVLIDARGFWSHWSWRYSELWALGHGCEEVNLGSRRAVDSLNSWAISAVSFIFAFRMSALALGHTLPCLKPIHSFAVLSMLTEHRACCAPACSAIHKPYSSLLCAACLHSSFSQINTHMSFRGIYWKILPYCYTMAHLYILHYPVLHY